MVETKSKKGSERHSSQSGRHSEKEGFPLYVAGDQIGYWYEIIHFIGYGSFGHVYSAFDHKECENVAIKVVQNTPKTNKQAWSEIWILAELNWNDPEDKWNIVWMK